MCEVKGQKLSIIPQTIMDTFGNNEELQCPCLGNNEHFKQRNLISMWDQFWIYSQIDINVLQGGSYLLQWKKMIDTHCSSGSRISRRGVRRPRGGGGGRQLLRWLRFKKFVCQNKRIWTRRGGARRRRPLDPPLHCKSFNSLILICHTLTIPQK